MTHIDDWIDTPSPPGKIGECYAKFMFWYFRYPAWAQFAFRRWMTNYKLFCTFNGERYRVTGASRMGDIWLTKDFNRDAGYELRADVTNCDEWSDNPLEAMK